MDLVLWAPPMAIINLSLKMHTAGKLNIKRFKGYPST